MSQDSKHKCESCGETFDSPQQLGGHKAGSGGECGKPQGDSEASPDASQALHADDVRISEIEHATANMDQAGFDQTLAYHDFKPAKNDTLRTAVAKCLIREKSGGREDYCEVFGKCDTPDCDYGANGFERTACKSHAGEDGSADTANAGEPKKAAADGGASSEQASEDTPDTREAPEATPDTESKRANYVAKLMQAGAKPAEAEQAATVRFGEQ